MKGLNFMNNTATMNSENPRIIRIVMTDGPGIHAKWLEKV